MINLLISLVVICLIGYLFYWLINYLAPPEPVKKVAIVILVVVLVLALLGYVMPQAGLRLP